MGIRQSLNENSRVTLAVTILVFVSAGVFYFWYSQLSQPKIFSARAFFSDDDGTTWFVDEDTKIAPFDHNGKAAVLARVFKCNSNGKLFIGYLEKFTDERRKTIGEARTQGHVQSGPKRMDATASSGIMVKKPHGGTWVADNSPEAKEVKNFTCPDGSSDYAAVPP